MADESTEKKRKLKHTKQSRNQTPVQGRTERKISSSTPFSNRKCAEKSWKADFPLRCGNKPSQSQNPTFNPFSVVCCCCLLFLHLIKHQAEVTTQTNFHSARFRMDGDVTGWANFFPAFKLIAAHSGLVDWLRFTTTPRKNGRNLGHKELHSWLWDTKKITRKSP